MSELDQKVSEVFPGKVVRKDLVRKVKVGANVPVFVLEYLLGKYCATNDPVAIEAGMRVVHNTLASHYVRPDESNKAQALVRDKGRHTFIDKVQVRYVSDDDKYWAELKNFGHRYVHIPDHYIRKYDRLLVGGIWAQIELRHQYDAEAHGPAKRSPFWIDELKPIQIATFDLEEYRQNRRHFTTDEWLDLLIRTMGLESSQFSRRVKMLLLVRLIPLCERNYNLVELGPRGTGKSYAYQELSPYAILLTGPTTVANLFYNIATNRIGLVGIWDAIAFDEVADLQKMPKEVVTTLKTYCESGTFARGKDSLTGMASIAMFGNTNQPVEVMVRTSHLFLPMPDVIREDLAFLDRIHFYLPGWEIPKMRVEFFTDHYGFVVDYLAEALRELRKHNYTEAIDRYFLLGSHLNARDVKAVRKTVSGLIKLLYPHGEYTKEELAELLELALEGRRRVKEQLKKMGAFEYHQTSFSFIDQDTREERFVGVPEQGGCQAISSDPLPPGSVYAASVDDEGKVGLYRLEVGCAAGTGKLRNVGVTDRKLRDSIDRAFSYLQTQKEFLGIRQLLDATDFQVEAIDLLGNHASCEVGVAFVVAVYSALRRQSVRPAMVVLGDLSIQGTIKALRSLIEPLQVAMDNGARRALLPLENKRAFTDVPSEIVERIDPIFYSDPRAALQKALESA
ncbi:MAG: protease Lon-related BREX system protein BrxL [Gemmatales bacterium]|nr:protease Lon-related BREX system protein BrxL [Gemmatales bacterium]MDW7993058.1 protease Lon-related BREX system protein BrxL [Gemmatales bacterium]